MRRVLVFAVAVGMMMAMAAPASAAKPVVFEEGDSDVTEIFGPGEACDGFAVEVRDTASFIGKLFFDNQGDAIRLSYHARGTSYISKVGGDVVATDRWAARTVFDLEPGTGDFIRQTDTGNTWNVHAGAGGVLVNDSGRVVFDSEGVPIIVNGPHEGLFEEFGDLCAALDA
jgi:hypothetical protein